MIRLLIVDPDHLMCNLVASVLQNQADIQVMGMARDITTALAQAPDCDVILASAHLPAGSALELTRLLKAARAKVVITGLVESHALILPYIEAGATGYVLRDSSSDELVRVVRAVYCGEALVSPAMGTVLIDRLKKLQALSKRMRCEPLASIDINSKLTEREQEVLALMSQGLTNHEIADKLVIELGTVKNHVHRVLKKLDASSRAEAARYLTTVSDSSPSNEMDVRCA